MRVAAVVFLALDLERTDECTSHAALQAQGGVW